MSTEQVQQATDQRIIKAIKSLAQLLNTISCEAEEADDNTARKSELEAWIGTNKPEIDQRIMVS
jgi:hypothetical protein